MSLRLPGGDFFLPGGSAQVFRAVRTAAASGPRGKVIRSGVGISTSSQREAEELAAQRAKQNADAAAAGREPAIDQYAYAAERRLEPVVEVLRSGSVTAPITVNSYGSLVMNASAALFADVDGDDDPAVRNTKIPQWVSDLASRRGDLGFKAYRTRAGWRFLCTTALFDPTSDDTRALLRDLRSDDKYVLLCRAQRSFRARLTPKPWRAGHVPTAGGTDGVDRGEMQEYVDRTWQFATTRFIGQVGKSDTHPDLQPLIDYHDRWTQATSGKQLA